MTDSSPRDLDQLASDLVDGLLPPAEAARARREPEVAARAARIEALRSALRSVPPASPDHVSRAVGAAVTAAAFANPGQRGRRPLTERARPWLVAAAVVVFGGLATAGLVALDPGDSGDEDTAIMSDESDADDGVAPESSDDRAADDSSGTGGDEPTTAPPVASDLGEAADPDQLAALVEQRSESFTAQVDEGQRIAEEGDELPDRSSAPGAAGGSCAGLSDAGDATRGTSIFSADATYQGAPVRVHLYERDGETRLVATDHACANVVDEPFNP